MRSLDLALATVVLFAALIGLCLLVDWADRRRLRRIHAGLAGDRFARLAADVECWRRDLDGPPVLTPIVSIDVLRAHRDRGSAA